jgi:hypothetical protein
VAPFVSPDWFIKEQISSARVIGHSENARLVALQLGNAYFLLFMVGVAVLYTTTELRVVRNYLWALWIADLGHIGLTAYALGFGNFIAFTQWNAMTWGNIGATVRTTLSASKNSRTESKQAFLCLTRTAYLLGLFGPDEQPLSRMKKMS